MLPRNRGGLTCVVTFGIWTTPEENNDFDAGAYPTLELYGNANKGSGGTDLLVHSRHLFNTSRKLMI